MTSTLLIPGSRPGTYPLIEEEELQKQSSIALMSDHRITYTRTVVVVICEPRGLNNPITIGIKTSKA